MGKVFDKILFSVALITLTFTFASVFSDRRTAIYVSLAVYLTAVAVYFGVKAKLPKYKGITPSELPVALALIGTQKATDIFYKTVPEQNRIYIKPPFFAYEWKGVKYLVCVAYKFINLTQEDIASTYREAEAQGITRAVILSRAKDRKTLTLGAFLPINITYPDKYAVYKYLKRHNALPQKPKKQKYKKRDFNLKDLAQEILAPRKAKYYLFLSIIFAVLALFTPLKVYYLCFSIIPLALSAITLLYELK